MKQSILAVAALLALTAGTATAANAVEFNVGPGGVHVGPGYYHHYRDYGDNCRVVIDHRTNRFGEDVTVRRRICD
jgi:opacity protein-like surface antigen